MKIETHYSLKNWNTFGVDETAAAFVSVDSVDALKTALSHPDYSEHFILGGGSNLAYPTTCRTLYPCEFKGTSIVEENEDAVVEEAGETGTTWCIGPRAGLCGQKIYRLFGNVGCPIQNIGAYGVELEDVLSVPTAKK